MSNMSNFYALLVGINDYPDPVPRLGGCLNDLEVLQVFLQTQATKNNLQLHLRTLKNEEARRDRLIQAFRKHLGQAKAGDQVLFAFSGHGSQEQAPPELWHLEPDRLNETLLCWDSRLPSSRDLADKELAHLIAEVAAQGPQITVILDCCHSGSGSRLFNARYVEPDRRPRFIESYLWHLTSTTRSASENSQLLKVPRARHILLAACRDIETAKEDLSKKRGAFSYFLMETLNSSTGALTYRDVFKRTHALVTSQVPNQTPQLEATHDDDLDLPFLGLGEVEKNQYFTVSYRETYGWVIDAGALSGIPTATSPETTHLALLPFGSDPELQRRGKIGEATVLEVLPQLSRISITGMAALREDEVYWAIATSMPLPRLGVTLTGEDIGVDILRKRLMSTSIDPPSSLYLTLVDNHTEAKFQVQATNGRYQILDAVSEHPLVSELVGFSEAIADKVIQRLEHIARWLTAAGLSSSPTSQIPSDAITLEILHAGQLLQDPQILFEYQYQAARWQQPTFQIRLTNTSELTLYCALLDLTERYAISPFGFEAGGVWLQPGETAWAQGGNPLYASVPKELWQQGITEYRDIFKLVVCTAEFDARLMAQGNLDASVTRTAAASEYRPGTLNRLMRRVQQRDLSAAPEDDTFLDDWCTTQVTIVTVRPQAAQTVATSDGPISLGANVVLQPHDGLRATVRLSSLPAVTRSLDQPTLPLIFSPNGAASEPLYFTRSRGHDPGLSVLELEAISPDSFKTVTAENPLRLSVPMPLETGEFILPIAYDGEFFLPLGRSHRHPGHTEITLERLPEPSSQGERSLGGSIRIFFQKLLSGKLGLEFDYPQISAIYLQPNGSMVYEKERTVIRAQVAEAKRVLLLIHGLLGDTPNLFKDVQTDEKTVQFLRDQYDIILGFDYESFNTSVEETARQLKLYLESLGLHSGHHKTLDVVGYELGGLISRWLVEREGGNQMISHLVLLGTPNAGTPWSTLQAWSTAALGLGLNSLSTVAWPVKVIGSLAAAIEVFGPGSKMPDLG